METPSEGRYGMAWNSLEWLGTARASACGAGEGRICWVLTPVTAPPGCAPPTRLLEGLSIPQTVPRRPRETQPHPWVQGGVRDPPPHLCSLLGIEGARSSKKDDATCRLVPQSREPPGDVTGVIYGDKQVPPEPKLHVAFSTQTTAPRVLLPGPQHSQPRVLGGWSSAPGRFGNTQCCA